jgi:hypothetical protein
MSLSDIDRPITQYHCEAWGRTVKMRPIATRDLLQLNHDFAQVHGENATSEQLIGFYGELLERCCEEPSASAQEWIDEVRASTLVELGQEAARISGLLAGEEKKSE